MSETTLFISGQLCDHLARMRVRPAKALQAYDPDQLLVAAEADVISYLIGLGTVNELVVDRSDVYVLDPSEITKRSHDSFDLALGVTNRRVTRWTLVIPFSGDPDLFKLRASMSTTAPPRAEIVGYEIRLHCDSDYGPRTAAQLTNYFESELDHLDRHIGFTNSDIVVHNKTISNEIPGKVSARRAKHLADKQLQVDLGYPVKHRGDSSTFSVPINRRLMAPTRPRRPEPTGKVFTPEPCLADSDYEDAIAVLLNSRNAIERNPSTAAKLNEEELRNLLLINLNARFEGNASGEVFNGYGKTDILVRVHDKNIFIGECKFWGGPKKLVAAIDQLLSYTTWRDTKAALLLFVKSGDVSSISAKAIATIKEHSNFKRIGVNATEDRHDFVLHAYGDSNREIRLALMLFLIPRASPE